MAKFSMELIKVFDLASKTYFYCSKTQISSVNLLLSMAMEKSCYAYEVLSRLGLDHDKAKSFVISTAQKAELSLSKEGEESLIYAKKIACESGYENICSHHLLLAIVVLSHNSARQMLCDYQITSDTITTAVNAMNHYKIGDEYTKGKNIKISQSIKNKQLEKEILKHLKNDIYK